MRAICPTDEPTPPTAPDTSMRSPGCGAASSSPK
jgi:hypothetical protein